MVDHDYYAFSDLAPGSSFTLTVEILSDLGMAFRGLDELGNVVVPFFVPTSELFPTVVVGNVPLSGELVIHVAPGEGSTGYIVGLDAPRVVVPEPRAGMLLALGLGSLPLVRRRSLRAD